MKQLSEAENLAHRLMLSVQAIELGHAGGQFQALDQGLHPPMQQYSKSNVPQNHTPPNAPLSTLIGLMQP